MLLVIISGALLTSSYLPSAVLQHPTASILTTIGIQPSANSSFQAGGDVMEITCDAPRYGQNVKPASCQKALEQVIKDGRQITFSDRSSIVPNDIPLPYRIQSSQ